MEEDILIQLKCMHDCNMQRRKYVAERAARIINELVEQNRSKADVIQHLLNQLTGDGSEKAEDPPLIATYNNVPACIYLSDEAKFSLGDSVTKKKGSSWTGEVVGFYSTSLTKIGYAVESQTEKGSVQIYPEAALKKVSA